MKFTRTGILVLSMFSLTLSACGCSYEEPLVNYQPPVPPGPEEPSGEYSVVCDFETKDIGFKTNDALIYSIEENTDLESGNASAHYGQVISAGGQWELIYSEEINEPFNFTDNGAKFTIKVVSPKVGGKIFFKLEGAGVNAIEITDVTASAANQWHTLTYDFTEHNLPDGKYNKIVLIFDAGETGSGETWKFDDIFQMKGEGSDPGPAPDPAGQQFKDFCNFEDATIQFNVNESDLPMSYEVCDNPLKEGINTSDNVGHVVSGGHQWEFIWSNKFTPALTFSEGGLFKMKVLSPKDNGKVYFKIEGGPAKEITDVTVPKANVWTELEFDFSGFNLPDGVYNNFVLLFDAGETGSGEHWYFDDIQGPQGTLMTRSGDKPVLTFGPEMPKWRNEHIANAAILSPDETPDGKWRMYIRGSGYNADNEYHDQIGLFTQDPADFKPFGPWDEYEGNPIIAHGAPGTCDELHLLDCAPCVGKEGRIWFYYQAVRGTLDNKHGSLACRESTDDGHTFTLGKMLKDGVGCSEAIYHDGKYYIYYGYGFNNGQCKIDCAVTEDPMDLGNAQIHEVLLPGGGPGDFDSRAVNGIRIFRLKDVDKWFAVYQGSSRHFDFPDRFHVIYSDDLLNWTKVDNDIPFFKRGQAGKWDQGGIWYGEVIEVGDMLYMYYEGWGCEYVVPDRDEPYFGGGHSSTGAASVSKAAFLEWCGM